jgi:3-hydroxyacyl-[acyl-carrier-protein] dehydratase
LEPIEIHDIMRILPHRYPLLLIDRVTDLIPGEEITGYKNVTFNEPFFLGHFPGLPVMPGVLILEALAQSTGVLAFKTREAEEGINERPQDEMYLFVSIDNVRFRRQVEPGDQLTLHSKLLRRKRGMWKFDCVASVGEEVAAQAEIMCAAREIVR